MIKSVNVIWKATIEVANVIEIVVPHGSKFIYVDNQGDNICVWYMCDPRAIDERRRLSVLGTGMNVPFNGSYIGSCQIPPYVWHVFELPMK